LFVLTLRRVTSRVDAAGRAMPWGLASVGSMLVASILAWVLAVAAGTASVETVGALRTANFIAGGTAHVVLLGVFVLLAARIPNTTKPIRVLSIAAAVPAVLSLSSLVVFEGAALILLGRLLCMVWAICAAVSLRRRIGKGEVV
ncbi:hypothetical protein, partial [Intrasporangium sp.]|uniref:hypothetical protein n=1 Tax=Intrasporangium sp. TaxID=1925024 RepID=UPI00293B1A1E